MVSILDRLLKLLSDPYNKDEHTEELLTLHEVEIQKLKEERRIKAPLLAAIKKYFEICEEEKELAVCLIYVLVDSSISIPS